LTGFDLTGRRAVVTGACGRLGHAIAGALSRAGAAVVGVDTAAAAAAAAAGGADIGEARDFDMLADDVSDPAAAAALARRLAEMGSGFDIWVNAAYPRSADWGTSPGREDAASWTANVTMQMTACCVASEVAAEAMARRGSGSVITLASIYGLVAPDFTIYEGTEMGVPAPYSAIKGGLINHTRYLAGRYGPQGVRVNAIAPGGVFAGQDPGFVAAYERRTALRRMADPGDIAGPAVFLASDAARYVTGVCLPVDGGWTAI
jgi:NAD(P)-dependent dehydrogenase (short-subunit alcohol dehydrogenase family)